MTDRLDNMRQALVEEISAGVWCRAMHHDCGACKCDDLVAMLRESWGLENGTGSTKGAAERQQPDTSPACNPAGSADDQSPRMPDAEGVPLRDEASPETSREWAYRTAGEELCGQVIVRHRCYLLLEPPTPCPLCEAVTRYNERLDVTLGAECGRQEGYSGERVPERPRDE